MGAWALSLAMAPVALGEPPLAELGPPHLQDAQTAPIVQLVGGGSHTCALRADGRVSCAGLGSFGQLGHSRVEALLRPQVVAGLVGAVELAAGRYFTCMRRANGQVGCVGEGGQLGVVPAHQSRQPRWLAGVPRARQMSAGATHSCLVDEAGQVWCWGSNEAGQLGVETPRPYALLPVKVAAPGLGFVRQVATGNAHTCALTDAGEVTCWGQDTFGQAGGEIAVRRLAERGQSPVRVVAGAFHTCVQTAGGALGCLGRNDRGQLGSRNGPDSQGFHWAAVPPVAEVALGADHTCVCTRTGQVWCFGDNHFGQLGRGGQTRYGTPAAVPLPGPCAQLAAGEAHTCVLLAQSQAVYCFGRNGGQLGDGSAETRVQPVRSLPF